MTRSDWRDVFACGALSHAALALILALSGETPMLAPSLSLAFTIAWLRAR